MYKAVLQIHDISVRIRIRGSMSLTNGSGFGSGSYLLLFESIFTSFSKIKRQKEVTKHYGRNQGFLTIFA
jgi:hypothetical protein